jgi:hypothetical protein
MQHAGAPAAVAISGVQLNPGEAAFSEGILEQKSRHAFRLHHPKPGQRRLRSGDAARARNLRGRRLRDTRTVLCAAVLRLLLRELLHRVQRRPAGRAPARVRTILPVVDSLLGATATLHGRDPDLEVLRFPRFGFPLELLVVLEAQRDAMAATVVQLAPRRATPASRLAAAQKSFGRRWFSRATYRGLHPTISTATASRDLRDGTACGLLESRGEQRLTEYRFRRRSPP